MNKASSQAPLPPAQVPAKSTGLVRIYRATRYSWLGLRAAFQYEAAFRQELAIGLIMAPAAFFVGHTVLEIALLLATLALVLIVELLNSAIETLVDRVGLEHNELSGRAKDMGSAAVMISLMTVVLIWSLIMFYPRG